MTANTKTARQWILAAIYGRWRTAWQVQAILANVHGIFITESSTARRIRELKEPRFGHWTVSKRPASKGNPCCEYRVSK